MGWDKVSNLPEKKIDQAYFNAFNRSMNLPKQTGEAFHA